MSLLGATSCCANASPGGCELAPHKASRLALQFESRCLRAKCNALPGWLFPSDRTASNQLNYDNWNNGSRFTRVTLRVICIWPGRRTSPLSTMSSLPTLTDPRNGLPSCPRPDRAAPSPPRPLPHTHVLPPPSLRAAHARARARARHLHHHRQRRFVHPVRCGRSALWRAHRPPEKVPAMQRLRPHP